MYTVVQASEAGHGRGVERGEIFHKRRARVHRISAGYPAGLPCFSTPSPQPMAELRVAYPPS